MSKMLLSDLIDSIPAASTDSKKAASKDDETLEITHVTADSRDVRAGSLFVAVEGVDQDGVDYIPQAIEKGATAILTRQGIKGITVPDGVTHITTDNDRRALAKLAAKFYSPQPKKIVAITGTDGKTSTAEFFRQLIEATDTKATSLGTLGIGSSTVKLNVPALNTSPDPVLLHKTLQKLGSLGCDHVAIEASSHGLDQSRLDGVELTAGAFTNFGRDHMDYHKTIENYFQAKMQLFWQTLPRASTAVAWGGEKRLAELAKICTLRKHKLVTYGEGRADLQITHMKRLPSGLLAQLNLHGHKVEVELGLIGDFQLLNILAAVGLAEACGKDILTLSQILHRLSSVRGRLEKVASLDNGATIYIDYAHTPLALEKALQVMRGHCHGKLGVVFGCGGDRDSGKRPLMGKAATEFADWAIITDDNPRTENAATIRKQVKDGCADKQKARIIGDRKKAISTALGELSAGDVLLVAGKGHEDYQIIGTEKHPFDDAAVIRGLL